MKLMTLDLAPGDMIVTNRGCETVKSVERGAVLTTSGETKTVALSQEWELLLPVDDEWE